MRTGVTARIAASAFAAWFVCPVGSALAQGAPPALSGTIASDREGPMEGVLVSAKKQGSTITVTVVSDAKGAYAFPAGRLDAVGELFELRRVECGEHEDWAVVTWAAVGAEVAAAFRISLAMGGSYLRYALAMRERLPGVAEVFRAGDIDCRTPCASLAPPVQPMP